jgi:hypothetical protein
MGIDMGDPEKMFLQGTMDRCIKLTKSNGKYGIETGWDHSN